MVKYVLHKGNNKEVLRAMSDNSIDAVITDPPYELGFMGKSWDNTGIAYDVELWKETLRVLKPGGYLLSFGGSRTYHRMACAIEDAGFEIRDQIQWIYGSGFPKSHNLKGEYEGMGTALKPAHEPICLARKIFKGTVLDNVSTHSTGALNIDDCKIEGEPWVWGTQTDIKSGNFNSARPRDGNVLATNIESDPKGRWPANVIHDGSEEVIQAFPNSVGQLARAKSDGSRMNNLVFGIMNHGTNKHEPRIELDKSASRFFYCAKASVSDRKEGCENIEKKKAGYVSNTSGQHITRSDEGYEVKKRANNHPTVKPTALMRYLVRMITPKGGIILDMFAGSGSTGKAAILEGFDCILIEKEDDYSQIITARLEWAMKQIAQQTPVKGG